ncbi:MAG: hypothetical protein M1368_12860 [Thaumarchaeota archaeon]|nr:hypothetical protein [Nitrososphaerota archaeon]
MARRIQQSTPRGFSTKSPQILVVIIVLVILASGIGFVYAYPTIAHYFQPQTGLASSVQITGMNGQIIYSSKQFTPLLASVILPNGQQIYDSTLSGAGGSYTYNLGATIAIQSGTPTNYTVTGGMSMFVNGKNTTAQPITMFQQGAPPTSQMPLASVSQDGQQLWGDIGAPSGLTTAQTYQTYAVTQGSVTVCFTEGPCETKSWSIPNLLQLSFEAIPNVGAFTVSVSGGSNSGNSGGTQVSTTATSSTASAGGCSLRGLTCLSGVELPNLVFCQNLLC